MKKTNSLILLAWFVALAAATYAGLGLFWPGSGSPYNFTTLHGQIVQINARGIYQFDPVINAAGNRGTDAVTLCIAVPLLVVAILLYQRGSLKGGLLLTGVLSYFLYNTMTMAFSVAYNNLVFLYIAAFSASFFAFILACASFDLPKLPTLAQARLPHRGIAIFLCFAGIATACIWLSDMIPAILRGGVPAMLGSYTTIFTYAFDLAIITPTVILAGIFLNKRRPLGYLLAPVMLILCTLIGLVVIGQTVFQLRAGISFSPGQFVGLIGSWVIMGAFAVGLLAAFFNNISGKGK